MSALRRHYGQTPLHLLAHLSVLAVTAAVVLALADAREALQMLMWFVLALVLHDLVLLPFYTVLDRASQRAVPRRAAQHLRVPLGLSALLLLLFFPQILGRNDASFENVAGVAPDGYLERWLLVSAALFAASGVLYLVRSRTAALEANAS